MGECESDGLKRILVTPSIVTKSLAIFFKAKTGKAKIGSNATSLSGYHARHSWQVLTVKHLEIHQFVPQIEKDLIIAFTYSFPCIETLILRFPPRRPKRAGDTRNLCAYINLRTQIGRYTVAEEIMKTLQRLKRLVFVVHERNYEYRRDPQTGIIAKEKLTTLDQGEWALVE